MSKDFIINELQTILQDISKYTLDKYKIKKEDLQYLDYKFNSIVGLFVAYNNDSDDKTINKKVTKKKKKTTTTKRKYTKKVYKTDEVMQIVGDNKDENIH